MRHVNPLVFPAALLAGALFWLGLRLGRRGLRTRFLIREPGLESVPHGARTAAVAAAGLLT